jgi:uncharacterized membrane protein
METHDSPEKTYDLERLIFFSDGVFAIVITLLVIELHPPANWDRTFDGLIRAEWRSLLAYAVSFVAVGSYWNAHRQVFRKIVAFHPGLVFFNLLLLAFVVLLPFANQLIFETGPRGEPFAILLGLISAIGVVQALLWGFAAFVAKVVDARIGMAARLFTMLAMGLTPGLVSYVALAASRAGSATMLWVAVPVAVGLAVIRRRLMANDPARTGKKAA